MARKPKAKPNSEHLVERIVDKNLLASLVKMSKSTKERTSSISGEFGEKVKSAVENGHLDKKAFAIACSIFKINDELRRNAVLRNVPLYFDMLAEMGLFPQGHHGDLVENAQKEADDEADDQHEADPEAAAAAENAARIESGITELTEGQDGAVAAAPAPAPIDLTIPERLDRRKKRGPNLSVVGGEQAAGSYAVS